MIQKAKKAAILIATLFSINVFISSCCGDGYTYEWTYIIAQNLEDWSVSDSATISLENYGIQTKLFTRKYETDPSLFLKSARATSCDTWYPMLDTITNIRIRTVNALAPGYGAMSEVSNLFQIDPDWGEKYSWDSLGFVLEQIPYGEWRPLEELRFYPDFEIFNDTTHAFIIDLYLSDERILSDTTPPVKFTP